MAKPTVTVNPGANQYVGDDERIIEFSDRQLENAGGLISLRRSPRGRLTVSVYRCDPTVDVVIGRPDVDDISWDARYVAVVNAEECLRRLVLSAPGEEGSLNAALGRLREIREDLDQLCPE